MGANRVTIDGLNSGGNGLLLRSTKDSMTVTVCFNRGASHNTVRNCTLEGRGWAAQAGVVTFGSAYNGAGNDDNTIANNVIRDRSDTTGVPGILIYSLGTIGAPNSGNVIRDNTLMNFYAAGIWISGDEGDADWTISGNTMYQESIRTYNLTGIYLIARGTNSITGNTIRTMRSTKTVQSIRVDSGGHTTIRGDTTISGNRIMLTMASTTYAWYGIEFFGGDGRADAVTLSNNEITLSPSNSANTPLYGIYESGYSGNTFNAYHNSVYVGGTATGSSSTWAYARRNGRTDTATVTNNIFINGRTGGSGSHFAAGNQSAGGGTFTSDHNLFAGTGTTAASFMDWGTSASGTPVSFATWQTSSGGDSASYGDLAANISAAGLFTAPAAGDLSIQTGSDFAAPPLPSDRGVTGTGVTDDYSGTLRSATMPDLGAFEFTVDRTGLAGPDTLAGGWGYYDTLGIAGDTVTAGSAVNAVTVTVASGATLDLAGYGASVGGSMTNNGSLRQTKIVTSTTTFLTFGTQYYGVEIDPGTNDLGSTTVTVQGNQGCAGAVGTPLNRCYEITPTTAASSNIKFYFSGAELQAGQTLDALNVWHSNGATWDLVTKGATGGDNGCDASARNCFVEGTGITAYSPFQLKNNNPLAVPLETLAATATPAGALIAWETTNELDALGYHVYRADAAAGAWTRLTGTLLPSQAPGAAVGHAYRWLDVTAQRGAAYRYRVAAVATSGAETPLAAVAVQMPAAWLWLPVLTR